jgi:sec-independent protein translocase protein TatA
MQGARARLSRRGGRRRPDAKEVSPVDDKILIVILVLAILFGASRLPSLGRNFGQGIREFKKGIAEGAQDDDAQAESAQAVGAQAEGAQAEGAQAEGADPPGNDQSKPPQGPSDRPAVPQRPTHEV